MERVTTFSHQKGAIISGEFAGGTSAVKLDSTDATDLIFRHVPPPCSNGVPFLYLDLHVEIVSGYAQVRGLYSAIRQAVIGQERAVFCLRDLLMDDS